MRVRVRARRTADAGRVGLMTHWAGLLGCWVGFNKKEKNPTKNKKVQKYIQPLITSAKKNLIL